MGAKSEYKTGDFNPSTGDFLPWVDLPAQTPSGNVFRLAVRNPDQLFECLDADLWYVWSNGGSPEYVFAYLILVQA